MKKNQRIRELTLLLTPERAWSLAALATKLGVSEKTLRRYLKELRDEWGYAIKCVEGIWSLDGASTNAMNQIATPLYASTACSPQAVVTVTLSVDANAHSSCRNVVWHASQRQHSASDGSILIQFDTGALEEVMHEVLSWGGMVAVISPIDLRNEVVRRARLLLRRHSLPDHPER